MNLKSILIKTCTGMLGAMLLINSAIAGIITSKDTNKANLQGLEWLSWDETFGQSRNSIENGFNNFIADGWRYAEQDEMSALVSSLDITSGWLANSNVQWLRDIFFPSHQGQILPMFGDSATCGQDSTCHAHYDFYELGAQRGWSAYNANQFGKVNKNYTGVGVTSVLVREVQPMQSKILTLPVFLPAPPQPLIRTQLTPSVQVEVAEPASLAIFSLGLLGLSARRMKRKSLKLN